MRDNILQLLFVFLRRIEVVLFFRLVKDHGSFIILHDSVDLVQSLNLIMILDYLLLKPFLPNNNGILGFGDSFDLRARQVELPHLVRELSLKFSKGSGGFTQGSGQLHLTGVVLHARNIT